MAQCSACKQQLPPDAVFCPLCGQPAPARAPAAGPAAAGGAAAGVRVAAAVTASPAAVVGTLSGLDTIPGVPPPPPPPPDLREGDVFHGRYTIERPLGAGAMGVVYAALDQVTGEKVALKLINPALADRPTARERFVREGLMARNVRHPNVVSMYDVGDAGGQIYLVMQYLGGESLRKWLRRSLQEARDISFDEARGIIRAVLEGLSAAHAAGVVHRDLKPENVMLTGDPHAGDCGLKILDFGIARAVGAASHVTTTSSSTGTPLYMAPEQKTAADTVGPAADLYA
ncbi:MAG: protein kinase, partial [Acidobacteria bacterium]|nr:protein kinase [Acidobacteriota bacterium]